MSGVHELAGRSGFGPIEREANEPVFHEEWERRVFALMMATFAAGEYNLDAFRHAIERMGREEYLKASYYEHWLFAVERLLVEKGCISEAELQGHTRKNRKEEKRRPILKAEDVERVVKLSGSGRIEKDVPPKFKPGDRIVACEFILKGHTRLPHYVQGKRGAVERDHGVYVFPDTNAHGGPESPQHVYNVRFDFKEIWGEDAQAKAVLHIDLWDDYMELAE